MQSGPCYLLTVNCSAKNNGRGQQSVNGLTIHEACLGVDIAGDYAFNRGGTVYNIDVSKAYLLGTVLRDDQGDAAAGATPPGAVRVAGSAQV
ncbi:hypothetical protein ACI78R_18185 [Geodermatophilus sp. SYSU D01106]